MGEASAHILLLAHTQAFLHVLGSVPAQGQPATHALLPPVPRGNLAHMPVLGGCPLPSCAYNHAYQFGPNLWLVGSQMCEVTAAFPGISLHQTPDILGSRMEGAGSRYYSIVQPINQSMYVSSSHLKQQLP